MAQNRITLDVWFLQSKYTKLTEKVSYSDLEGKKNESLKSCNQAQRIK